MIAVIKKEGEENLLSLINSSGEEIAHTYIDTCEDPKLASGQITIKDGHVIPENKVIHVTSEDGEKVGEVFMGQYEGVDFAFSDEALSQMLSQDWDEEV